MTAPLRLSLTLLGLALSGCGAKVVFDGEAGGAGTGGQSTTGGDQSAVSSGAGLIEEVVVTGSMGSSIAIDVDERTLGVIATLEAATPYDVVSFSRVRAPSGATVVESPLVDNTYDWSFYGAVSIAAPQVDHPESFPLAQGSWVFDYQSETPARAALWRRSTADGVFHGGVLDVNVFAPSGLVSEGAVLGKLAIAFDGWAGIELGDVRFFSLPDRYLLIDDDNVFDLLAETAAAENHPALNVMATAAIGGSFEGAVGFSLGIPGTPTLPGSNANGVVWMVLNDDFYDPLVLRHEAGHLAGLFHTTELVTGLADPLDDTPECADAAALLEACPDYDFTMFPTGGSGVGRFSPKETAVVHGSAIYRGVYEDGQAPTPPFGAPLARAPRRPSEAERADARRRWAAAAERAHAVGWRARLSSPAAGALLDGIGCPNGEAIGYFEVLALAGGDVDGELAALAQDESAPAFVRRRAARMRELLAKPFGP